jgi:E3 ubiquitin-protein ligase HERC2
MKPKLVEALLGYRVIDVACGKTFSMLSINLSKVLIHPKLVTGSGDAQTLCITDDDNVWSWGDGNLT